MGKRGWLILVFVLGTTSIRAQSSPDQSALVSAFAKAVPATLDTSPGQVVEALAQRLRREFDTWLEKPEVYRQRVLKECAIFPEGRIYPFAIPAMAYANLAFKIPSEKAHAQAQMRKLIDLLIAIEIEDIRPPNNDLTQLDYYRKAGTYLATLNTALGYYALATGDDHYANLQRSITALLINTMRELKGRPLASYPDCTWYFDTIMALVSCGMADYFQGHAEAAPLLRQHLEWRAAHATHAPTGLPAAYGRGLPRGCDLTMQICLLDLVAPETAREMYRRLVRHFWMERGELGGFAEWPVGTKQAEWGGDIDSGPIILGMGLTATGMGIGLVRGYGDEAKLATLARELRAVPAAVQLAEITGSTIGRLIGGTIQFDSSLASGFFYGDTILFYAVTWEPGLKRKP